jgi:hypothetical protein
VVAIFAFKGTQLDVHFLSADRLLDGTRDSGTQMLQADVSKQYRKDVVPWKKEQ